VDSIHRFEKLREIRFVFFTHKDVVRHDLVAKIIKAYEAAGGAGTQEKDEKLDEE
jgi:phosphate starvation-inducible protein PhoH